MVGIICLGFIYFFARFNIQRFNPELAKEMIDQVSQMRDKTDSPCKYAIAGEPTNSLGNYVKINFICPDGTSSINTIDTRSLTGEKWIDVIKLMSKVGNFDLKFEENRLIAVGKYRKWSCALDDGKLTNERGVLDINKTRYGLTERLICVYE